MINKGVTERVDEAIVNIDRVIFSNIDNLGANERGLLSQNILAQLRNLVEHVSLKVFSSGRDIDISYENIKKATRYIKAHGKYRFLTKFHKLLQITASHYTLDEENSERLMLKYYEYLLKIKSFLHTNYGLEILKNITSFPIYKDSSLNEYYEKIAAKIDNPISERIKSTYDDRYYIQKVKPFFVGLNVYYEVTFTRANDNASKFDRIIAFTNLDIEHYYAVKLSVSNDSIMILGKEMPIQIIDSWEVSIRPCEINNFSDLFGDHPKIGSTKEYRELMSFLTYSGLNLSEIIDLSERQFQNIKTRITKDAKVTHFSKILDNCRSIITQNKRGTNVLRYLLLRLNNRIIKGQRSTESCPKLSNLFLGFGCIPFDEMPFTTSLLNHNPKLSDLFECLNSSDKEHELFARYIKNNTEIKGQLYTARDEIFSFKDIDLLIRKYNDLLYYKHYKRTLLDFKGHIYIRGYEEDTFEIIKELKTLSSTGVGNFSNSVKAWLENSSYKIDCDEKSAAIDQLFEKSKVALIYGSAGTGKSTMINHISNFLNQEKKIYLANTNPAVDNLKRKVNAANCTYKTISKFLSPWNNDSTCDLLVIDECSTVSNKDMLNVLRKAKFKLLLLVGDVYQIESILFGNWFSGAKSFVPNSSVFELTKPYRSKNVGLLNLWKSVREIDDEILEKITKGNYSASLDESIFEDYEEDEIILCLNYDGLYGINNVNRFLQSSNKNVAFEWGIQTYKVNDPVLFNESNRFAPLIYNNLKGKIIGIEKFENQIGFDIELNRAINELDAEAYDFELLEGSGDGNSVIRFYVQKYKSTDEDDDTSSNTIVPFQIAYAVSIHKAQGLEYNSVKIVVTTEIEEMITHNIFYTAITRAREKLKIYWTPETENKVLKKLTRRFNGKDEALLQLKYNL